jgi:hypothetical protein
MIPDGGPEQGGTDAAGEQLPEILENSIAGHRHRGNLRRHRHSGAHSFSPVLAQKKCRTASA